MLVQCPKCKTTYKVSDELVKGASQSFRCSRCKHTFELDTGAESASEVTNAGAGESGENREPTFRFEPATRSEPKSSRATSQPTSNSSTNPKPASHNVMARDNRKSDGAWKDDRPFTMAASGTTAKDLGPATSPVEERSYHIAPPAPESSVNVLAIAPYRDQPASVMPYLTLMGLLVIFFGFVLAFHQTHPAAAEEWVRRIPLLGPSLVRNDRLKNGVLLKSIETKYQSLQGSREVVVLTGIAVNQNPVMIRNVQLAGQLFDQAGKEIERQTMWIGNAISSQIIRGMTAQDITDLQRLKPLKTFEIPPGDSVPFAIVFLRTGKQVKVAGCDVVSAEGDS